MTLSKTQTILGAALMAATVVTSFNAQAENTSGINPAGSYMGQLSTAIVQVTQDVDDRANARLFSQKLDAVLAQGAVPVGQAFGIGTPDGSRAIYGFVGANYNNVSACAEANGRPIGAWNIHSKGITPVPMNEASCKGFLGGLMAAYGKAR